MADRRKRLAALVALTAALFMTASTASAQGDDDDPAQVEAGMAVYETNCAGCHGSDGEGSNAGRPLTDVATEADRSVHITSVTDGKGGMPSFAASLSADEIDSAVSFVRLTFVSEAAPEVEEAAAPEALAETGVNSLDLAFIGLTFVLAGALVVSSVRRDPFLH